jgi:hypothetical protein
MANEQVKTSVKTKIWKRQNLRNQSEMSADARQLCNDVMSVIENNGEVTLPVCHWSDSFVTKRKSQSIVLIVGALILAGILSRGKMFH